MTISERVAVVPGVLALRPEYASIEDPVAELRTAVEAAREWVGDGLLVVANGSAMRTEKAPGHFDDRAEGFDRALGAALRLGDFAALRAVDTDLAAQLWADVAAFQTLPDREVADVRVDYDDAPYGVQYWVVRFECAS